MERVSENKLSQRADDGGNSAEPFREKHSGVCGRKPLVIRTARSSRKDANERTVQVNLGGIAEVLPFVPYLGRKVFCFLPHKTK